VQIFTIFFQSIRPKKKLAGDVLGQQLTGPTAGIFFRKNR
jgi:hypothetical protein